MKETLNLNGITDRELDLIVRFGKPKNTIGRYACKRLIFLPYGLVRKEIPVMQKANRHNDVVIELLKAQHGEDLDLTDVTPNDALAFYLFVRKELEYIQKLEKNYLSSEPEAEMIGAGINELNQFGALATIHSLAGGDILKHKAVEAMSYYEVYQVLKLEKINRDINKRYAEIMAAKNKK